MDESDSLVSQKPGVSHIIPIKIEFYNENNDSDVKWFHLLHDSSNIILRYSLTCL